jgi:hypothetical protein
VGKLCIYIAINYIRGTMLAVSGQTIFHVTLLASTLCLIKILIFNNFDRYKYLFMIIFLLFLFSLGRQSLDYDMYYYTKGLDSKYSFIYPIGQFMAIYLYENYKQDKENFIKEFKRSFLIYPTNPTLEAFNKVGINYQELKEGKVLKRILNEYKTKF